MKKFISLFLAVVLVIQFFPATQSRAESTVAVTSASIGQSYTAPEADTQTYNMNLDWQFLLPTQSNTIQNSLASSVDAQGKYFYDTDYDESTVKGAGYCDAAGNLVEGDVWTTVSIPHSITAAQAFAHNAKDVGETGATRSCLLYRKTFTVPAGSQKVFFELEGIRQAAYVWINGKAVGYYEAGITAMGFDISNYVNAGEEAVIAIAEDGTTARGATEYMSETKPSGILSSMGTEGFDSSTWALRNGVNYKWNASDFNEVQLGLVYNAYLHVTGSVYQTLPLYNNLKTTGNYIYADNFDINAKKADITVDAEVRNESDADKNLSLQVDVVDANGNLQWSFESSNQKVPKAKDAGIVYETAVEGDVYEDGHEDNGIGLTKVNTVDVTHIQATYSVERMRFWSVDDPYLYTVYTSLKDSDGKVIDVQKKETGFRKVSYSLEDGLEINDENVWLTGYAQRSTDEWAVAGTATDWLADYDMSLLKSSNANFIRWMHVAPKPANVRSADRYGVVLACPAGDKEGVAPQNRQWSQRTEAMRDVMIYYRNSPSVVFWETGNSQTGTAEQANEMNDLRLLLDPKGMCFIGARSTQAASEVNYQGNYIGTMLEHYVTSAKAAMAENGIYGPIMETEYEREEAPRRVWDDYSPPDYDYVNKWLGGGSKTDNYDIHDLTQEEFCVSNVESYATYFNNRIGGSAGTDYYSAAAILVWSDSNQHTRNSGTENCRTSGRVDPVRQTKESFYAMQTAQATKPAVHIIGHWSYPQVTADTYNYFNKEAVTVNGVTYYQYDTSETLKRDPTQKTVYVVGSADVEKVELYRVDQGTETLIGTCDTPDSSFIYAFDDIDVTKGDAVKAVAYNARQQVVATDDIQRTYNAYSLKLTPVTADAGWKADGSDIAFFDVEVLDQNGNVCALNYDKIQFTYSGNETFLGGYNSGSGTGCFQNSEGSQGISNYFGGNKDGVSTLGQDYVYAENGTNRVFVRASREAGDFNLTATLCDADGNPTSITTSAMISSSTVSEENGLMKDMQSINKNQLSDNAPETEHVVPMGALADPFTIDWNQAEKVTEDDQTVYYTISVNGEEMKFTHGYAYEGLSNSVFAPVIPVLDKLKSLGADIEYQYDTQTAPEDPLLTIQIDGGQDAGGTTLWCHPSENILHVNDQTTLPNDVPAIVDGEFCFEIPMIMGYIKGVSATQDKNSNTYTITYTAQ